METARERHLLEMQELRKALAKTKSPYARRDFEKALRRKEKELREYDRWRKS